MKFFVVFYLIFSISYKALALPAEPACSKFDYEINTLEAMLRTEQKIEKMVEDMKAIRETVLKELEEMNKFQAQLLEDFNMFTNITENQTDIEKERRREDNEDLAKTVNEGMESVYKTLEVINKKSKEPVIAFSVTKPTRSFVKGVPIFSETITNIGDGYNKNTGIFTSPTDGLYLLLCSVASDGLHDVHCYIYHNGSPVSFGRSFNDNSYTTAAVAVYLLLTKGDQVKLAVCGGWREYLYTLNRETSFSGALIKHITVAN